MFLCSHDKEMYAGTLDVTAEVDNTIYHFMGLRNLPFLYCTKCFDISVIAGYTYIMFSVRGCKVLLMNV